MSMLSSQCDELREKAKLLRGFVDGLKAPYAMPSTIKELMAFAMLDSANRMKEAADTIEGLRDRLQNQAFALGMQDALGSGTCEMKHVGAHGMNGVDFYECSSCGEETCIPTVMGRSEPPRYCPNCRAKVVER